MSDCSMRALLVLLLALGSCAPPRREPIDTSRRTTMWVQCLNREAVNLDDPSSDATSVGRAVLARCRYHWDWIVGATMVELPASAALRAAENLEPKALGFAVEAVLEKRARQRG
jgi:hypothetical protein